MLRPNLYIIGGQKCGTSALAHFLSQHPDICLAQGKEAHVFDDPTLDITRHELLDRKYQPLFSHYQQQQYRCDATPIYAYWQDLLPHIADYSPDAKIIFMLRDPVERAISQYMMESKRGAEPLPVLQAFLKETSRLKAAKNYRGWSSPTRWASYLDRGHFRQQVAAVMAAFGEENVLILHNQDLRSHHDDTMSKISRFLQISCVNIPREEVFTGEYQQENLNRRLAKYYAAVRLFKERRFVRQFISASTESKSSILK